MNKLDQSEAIKTLSEIAKLDFSILNYKDIKNHYYTVESLLQDMYPKEFFDNALETNYSLSEMLSSDNYSDFGENCSSTIPTEWVNSFINMPMKYQELVFRLVIARELYSKKETFLGVSDSERNGVIYNLIPGLKKDGWKVINTPTKDRLSKINWAYFIRTL